MTLDLHGVKHEEVEKLVEETILLGEAPFRIVTGNSLKMKELVKQVLEKHNFHHYEFSSCIITQ
jgi:hypothetical protein